MNKKRLLISIVSVAVFIIISDFVIHGKMLEGLYRETASLWRPESEMLMGWMLLGQITIGVFFTIIFAKGYEGRGWKEGLRYGLLMGAFSVGPIFIQYSVSPIPCELALAWAATALVQSIISGIIVAATYKN
jgi:hypothetical protein